MIYCVIPRELEDELYEKMVEYYKDNPNVTVIVDRREGEDRRAGRDLRRQARDQGPPPSPRRRARSPARTPTRLSKIAAVASTATKTFKNFIGGEWVDAASGETFETTSPATGEVLGVFPKSSAEDVDRAVEAAKAAYEEWRLVPAPRRGEILFRFGALLAERKDEVAELMAREMGKVLPEAAGDVQEAIDMSFYMGGEGRRLFGQTTPSELRDKFNMSVRQPIGVVGVITPWNFPIAIPSWKIAPALVCGNTDRLQAGDRHAAAGRALRRAARRGRRSRPA